MLCDLIRNRCRRAMGSRTVPSGGSALGLVLLTALTACADQPMEVMTDAGLPLRPGPHLFLDDHLIESSEGVNRVVVQPAPDPAISQPLVTGVEDWNVQPYFTVLRDSTTNRFRIWYNARLEGFRDNGSQLAYMESDDGINWKRPHRILKTPGPLKYGASVIDHGAGAPDPSRRFVMGWNGSGGLWAAVSSDGFAWTGLHPRELISHSHDISGLGYDPVRDRYLGVISVASPRQTLLTTSSDLLNWSKPEYVLRPDHRYDETQFYGMAGFLARGDLLIGMARVLRDDLVSDPYERPEDFGIGYTSLVWTRDGKNWSWDRNAFLAPDTASEEWARAFTWVGSQVPVGDRVYLYVAGYAHGHKADKFSGRQIGLMFMPRDRYVARQADSWGGVLRTRALRLEGSGLTLNVDASRGSMRAQVVTEEGSPVRGFSMNECAPIRSDELRAPLTCGRPFSELRGRTVRIEFHLRDARLFSMDLLP